MGRMIWVSAALVAALVAVAMNIGAGRKDLYATPAQTPDDLVFPQGFFWGAAIAAQQAESQSPSDWTQFERDAYQGKRFATGPRLGDAKPGHIHDLGSASEEARIEKTGFDKKYPEDIAMAKGMGLNAFRFSIDWARLFPRADMMEPDPAGVNYYKNILAELKKQGITPFGTLFHFSTPYWFFQEDGAGKKGWERGDALEHWERYVRAVDQHFGNDFQYWCTLNEPMTYIFNGYVAGIFPPLQQRKPKDLFPVVENMMRAHVIAYRILHEGAKSRNGEVSVGLTQHTRAFEAWRNWNPLDRVTAQQIDQSWNWDWLDSIAQGQALFSAGMAKSAMPDLVGTQDYVGINYYGRFYVETHVTDLFNPTIHYADPNHPKELANDLGWASYPHGFFQILTEAHERYKLPIYILENGTADRQMDDLARQKFLVAHVREVWLAIQQSKADIRSYVHWSLFDNFEWAEGFTARFGLVAVDYDNGFVRTPRPSAKIYSDIARNNMLSGQWIAEFGQLE